MVYQLKMKSYPAVYRWEDEGYYFGYVLAFGMCACSACGETITELKKNLFDVMQLLMSVQQKSKSTSIEITDSDFIVPSGYLSLNNWIPKNEHT